MMIYSKLFDTEVKKHVTLFVFLRIEIILYDSSITIFCINPVFTEHLQLYSLSPWNPMKHAAKFFCHFVELNVLLS